MSASCVKIQVRTEAPQQSEAAPARPQINVAQLSPRERALLQEFRTARAVCALSLRATQERLDESIEQSVAAYNLYHEAILVCGPDEDDSFEVAAEKAEKLAHCEQKYIADGVTAEGVVRRANWELREAKRQGLLK